MNAKLAVADAQRAADLLRPTWDATYQLDGWVSIKVPPALAYRAAATIEPGLHLHAQVDRPNVFIKVPATRPGLVAIEELIAAGVPINATLIFDAGLGRRYGIGPRRARRWFVLGLPETGEDGEAGG